MIFVSDFRNSTAIPEIQPTNEFDSKLKYHFAYAPNRAGTPDQSNDLPDYFKENHEWDVGILKAPACSTVNVIRLIKSARHNFENRHYIRSHMRNQGWAEKSSEYFGPR